jgi:hypothetical protein
VRELPWRDRLLLLVAPLALPAAALALRLRGLGPVQSALARRWPVPSSEPPLDGVRPDAVRRIVWTVEVAARRGPWPANCLQRSIVLWSALRRIGVESDLCIGVRRAEGSAALDFHAWIELGDEVLNDAPDIRQRFATFDRPIAPRAAVFS